MALFPETRWQVLAEATLDGDTAGRNALASICQEYRSPIMAFVLSQGYTSVEADDIVQDFFLELMKGRVWRKADKECGQFRHFLLGSLRLHLKRRNRDLNRHKRGGGEDVTSLESLSEDERIEHVDGDQASTEQFDLNWARFILEQSLAAVRKRYEARGQANHFTVLKRFLPGASGEFTVEWAARELGLSVETIHRYILRLRQDFRSILRGTVAKTVSAPHEVDEEMRYLKKLLSSAALTKIR